MENVGAVELADKLRSAAETHFLIKNGKYELVRSMADESGKDGEIVNIVILSGDMRFEISVKKEV